MMYLGKDPVGLATSIPVFGEKMEIEYGEYISTTDISIGDVVINHHLGVMPDFLFFIADSIELLNTYSAKYMIEGTIIKLNLLQTTTTIDFHIAFRYIQANSTNVTGSSANMSTTQIENFLNNNSFKFFGPSAGTLKANVKYNYIVGKFKEVTSNANE